MSVISSMEEGTGFFSYKWYGSGRKQPVEPTYVKRTAVPAFWKVMESTNYLEDEKLLGTTGNMGRVS